MRGGHWGYFRCPSHVERHNLTLRTFMKRFIRLSMGFSKKLSNLAAAVALQPAYYNFCWRPRKKGTTGQLTPTPAMMAGLVDKLWAIEDLYDAVIAQQAEKKKRERYAKLMRKLWVSRVELKPPGTKGRAVFHARRPRMTDGAPDKEKQSHGLLWYFGWLLFVYIASYSLAGIGTVRYTIHVGAAAAAPVWDMIEAVYWPMGWFLKAMGLDKQVSELLVWIATEVIP
jgi:hypothetical protein